MFYFCVSFLDLRVKVVTVRKLYIRGIKLKIYCPRWRFVWYNKAFSCDTSSWSTTWKLSYPTTQDLNNISVKSQQHMSSLQYFKTSTAINLVVNKYGERIKPFWVEKYYDKKSYNITAGITATIQILLLNGRECRKK